MNRAFLTMNRKPVDMKYLHTMIRVTDPDATVRFFELLGLKEVRRMENEKGRFTLIFLALVGLGVAKWWPKIKPGGSGNTQPARGARSAIR